MLSILEREIQAKIRERVKNMKNDFDGNVDCEETERRNLHISNFSGSTKTGCLTLFKFQKLIKIS